VLFTSTATPSSSRLDKVRESLGFDLSDTYVRHRLQLALDLRRLL